MEMRIVRACVRASRDTFMDTDEIMTLKAFDPSIDPIIVALGATSLIIS